MRDHYRERGLQGTDLGGDGNAQQMFHERERESVFVCVCVCVCVCEREVKGKEKQKTD